MRTSIAAQGDRLAPLRPLAIIRSALAAWVGHRHASTSAALAYYAAFSMAPVLVMVVWLSGLFYGTDMAQGHLMAQFEDLLGRDGADLLHKMMQASHFSNDSAWAAGIGLIGILFGATGVFVELSAAFERSFGLQRHYVRAWHGLVLERLKGLTLVVGVGFLLLLSLVGSAALLSLSEWLASWTSLQTVMLAVLQATLSFGMLVLMFTMMFRLMSPVRLHRETLLAGALVTATLFELGKWALGLYLGQGVVGSVFGAAGALAILLVWLYYASMVLLLGVEITQALHQRGESP
jgi:membrane protein